MSTMHQFLDPERLADLARDQAERAPTGEQGHMLQDQSRPLTEWFANKPDARLRVREALENIRRQEHKQ